MKRAASVPSQLNRVRKESLLVDRATDTAVSPADKASFDFRDRHLRNLHRMPTTVGGTDGDVLSDGEPSQAGKELPSTVRPTRSERTSSKETLKEGENSTVDLMRQSDSEIATSSGRRTSSKLVSCSESSVAEGSGRGRGTGLKSSTMINIQVAPQTLQHYKEEYHSAQSSGMWIFPDNTRRLCITTAGEQVMKIVGRRRSEARTHQANNISSEMQKV